MEQITWRQFKELVDKKLAELSTPEDTPIWYIDVSFPDDELTVSTDDSCGIAIS